MVEICMPSLGAEMEEGKVVEWYVEPGDRVERGQIVALLDTEKAEIDMESFETGWIEALLVQPGETVLVGTPMATVRSQEQAGAKSPAPLVSPADLEPPPQSEAPPASTPVPAVARERRAAPERRVRASPLARRMARERGIALESLTGSGPHHAIVAADIVAPGMPEVASATASSSEPLVAAPPDRAARRRRIIAAAMERSKREIPHYYLATTIDVTPALQWLETANLERPVSTRLLFAPLLVKAVANAARRFPQLHGHWIDGAHQRADAVHVGMVVSLRTGGIVVPTLRDADSRTLDELMDQIRDVVTRARSGRLRSTELSQATLAVTSLGEGGVESIYGVIYPPQVSILGFGSIHSEVRAEGDLLGTRSVLHATLAADHRASDGQEGSRFLTMIAGQLADPEEL